jgi:hypothetical protein
MTSTSTTWPLWRGRMVTPASPQVRVRSHRKPASCNTHASCQRSPEAQAISALRNARRSVINDHMAVPSVSGSGVWRTSARMGAGSRNPYLSLVPPPARDSMAGALSRLQSARSGEPPHHLHDDQSVLRSP